jgi:hypothetical protein
MVLEILNISHAGTSIERAVAVQFATDTGASLSLHDLSVRNLSADYDHFLDCKSNIRVTV